MYGAPPQQAQPSFYETTVAEVMGGPAITHREVEVIAAQPPWDIRDMQAKATANLILRGWTKNGDGVMVPPKQESAFVTKKTTAKKPAKKSTPRKK